MQDESSRVQVRLNFLQYLGIPPKVFTISYIIKIASIFHYVTPLFRFRVKEAYLLCEMQSWFLIHVCWTNVVPLRNWWMKCIVFYQFIFYIVTVLQVNKWKRPLFGNFSNNRDLCIITFCAPCVTFGYNMQRLHQLQDKVKRKLDTLIGLLLLPISRQASVSLTNSKSHRSSVLWNSPLLCVGGPLPSKTPSYKKRPQRKPPIWNTRVHVPGCGGFAKLPSVYDVISGVVLQN